MLTSSGILSHRLILKISVLIILLRNISLTEGLCNGIRLIVKRFQQHVIDVKILTDSYSDK